MNMAPERRSLSALCGGKAAKGWFLVGQTLVGQTFLSVRGSWAYYDPIKQSEDFPFLIFQWSFFHWSNQELFRAPFRPFRLGTCAPPREADKSAF